MSAGFQQIDKMIRYKPSTRVGRFAYRLAFVAVIIFAIGMFFRDVRALSLILDTMLSVLLVILLIFLGLRSVNRRLLWKVRNRLILTYLLMGLAPVVLFGTITGILGYVLAGQYATNSAITVLDETERRVQGEANTVAIYMNSHPSPFENKITLAGDYGPGQSKASLAYLDNGVWRDLPFALVGGKTVASPFAGQPAPSWLQHQFDGTISINGRLYLCSLAVIANEKNVTSVLGSIPVEKDTLDPLAAGLGRIIIAPVKIVSISGRQDVDLPPNVGPESEQAVGEVAPILRPEGAKPLHLRSGSHDIDGAGKRGNQQPSVDSNAAVQQTNTSHLSDTRPPIATAYSSNFNAVNGGVLPTTGHLLDLRVLFSAPFPVISWTSGEIIPAIVGVVSRPTVLYTRLFATSVITGSVVRVGLIVIAILFALLELVSLLMAVQLSRTITGSVAELYEGTTEIDRGNLAHRIPVERKDQLGALSESFNTMAASIEDLLVQQREKDRMLNELMIAQEVQKNLFPASPIHAGNLEVHALCMPARTVSGDYYDYITWDDHRLCIALGDISGKGISAALLMASLSSAVRAFTLGNGDGHSAAPSPSGLLGCLNRHLYRSTTPEKYATMFLAFFDSAKHTLTYSNGGHLPPLILSKDGTVQRLECGGAVVGLLDNLVYEQATVELRDGDLLVVYSDGLTEPEQGDEEFGEDRLRDFVRANESKGLDALASESIGAVKRWIGNAEQPDDMTILLARYN